MALKLGKLTVEIAADTSGLDGAVDKAKIKISSLEAAMKKQTKDFKREFDNFVANSKPLDLTFDKLNTKIKNIPKVKIDTNYNDLVLKTQTLKTGLKDVSDLIIKPQNDAKELFKNFSAGAKSSNANLIDFVSTERKAENQLHKFNTVASQKTKINLDATQVKTATSQFEKLSANLKKSEEEMRRNSLGAKGMSKGFAVLGGVIATAVTVEAVRKMVMLADSMSLLNTRLKMASSSVGEFSKNQKELLEIANKTGSSYQSIVDLFAKITMVGGNLGATNAQVKQLVETIANLNLAGGVDAEHANYSIMQLRQALGSGVLAGDELKSILENNAILGKTIADGLGVAIGDLKKLGAEGKLTSKEVFNAILSQSAKAKEMAEGIPLSIGRALEVVKNNFSIMISDINTASDGTQSIAQAIKSIGDALSSAEVAEGMREIGKEISILPEILKTIGGDGRGSISLVVDMLKFLVKIGVSGISLLVGTFNVFKTTISTATQGVLTLGRAAELTFTGAKLGIINVLRMAVLPLGYGINKLIEGIGQLAEVSGKLSFNKSLEEYGAKLKKIDVMEMILPKDELQNANSDFAQRLTNFAAVNKNIWKDLGKEYIEDFSNVMMQADSIWNAQPSTVKKINNNNVGKLAMSEAQPSINQGETKKKAEKDLKSYNELMGEMGSEKLKIISEYEQREKDITESYGNDAKKSAELRLENKKWLNGQLLSLEEQFMADWTSTVEDFDGKTTTDFLIDMGDEKLKALKDYQDRELELQQNFIGSEEDLINLRLKNQEMYNAELERLEQAKFDMKRAKELEEINAYEEFTKTTVDVMGRAGMEQTAVYKAMLVLEQIFAVKKLMIQAFSETNPILQGLAFAQAGLVAGMGFGDLVWSGGHIAGGQVGSNMIMPVVENGDPEMFIRGNQKFLLTGDKGGKVVSGRDMATGGSGAKVTIHNYAGVQVESSVSRDEVTIMVRRAEENAVKRVNSSLATGRGDTAKAIKSGYNVKRQVTR